MLVYKKILIDDTKKAVGVKVKLCNKKLITVMACKEVILSAGAINSPQLLMLSGVGPEEHLKEMGIKVIQTSPKVGKNLEDHVVVPLIITGKKGISTITQNWNFVTGFNKFPYPTILGHVALNKTHTIPDYQAYFYIFPVGTIFPSIFCNNVFGLSDRYCIPVAKASLEGQMFVVVLSAFGQENRGEIKLKSKDPEKAPLIYRRYFSKNKHLNKFAVCILDHLTVLNTTYFKDLDSVVVDLKLPQCKDLEFGSHDYWKCYALNTASSEYQPSGTCGMGPEGVVDERLRVRGLKRIRVVDASVMPTSLRGNNAATVIMIADKAADMIKSDYDKTI